MPTRSRRKDPLAEIQRAITGTLFRPLLADESMHPAAGKTAERLIKSNDRLTAFERLQIYNQQYWWRMLGAFSEDFRGLRAVLGETKFDRLAVNYLEAHGSHSWTLRNLGSQLVGYLEQHPALTHPRSALALDVARVEWARTLAFDDPEKPAITARQISKSPPNGLRLGLQPYISLLELHHPVDELMRTLKRTEISAVSNAVAATHTRRRKIVSVRRSRKPIHLAVHRVHFSVYYKRLDPEAYHLLIALREGSTLEDACATAFAESNELPSQSAARIQEWFATWMELGWFCRP
jgi:hypothetical protein